MSMGNELGNDNDTQKKVISNSSNWEVLKTLLNIPKGHQQKYKSLLKQPWVNLALGSMYGAFIGDALGSFLQFRKFTQIDVKQAMEMPGGGVFHLKPGQFTDDSQMAAHMLKALSNFDPNISFQSQKDKIMLNIAKQYTSWYRSGPFDIGITTKTALRIIQQSSKSKTQFKYSDLLTSLNKIKIINQKSQSNGSLMRITPMAFFMTILSKQQNKSVDQILQSNQNKNFIKDEINMTHGNQVIFKSSQAWIELLARLILRNQQNSKSSPQKIYLNFISKYKNNSSLRQWIQEAQKQKFMDGQQHIGWAKIAFTFSIHHIRKLLIQQKKSQNQMTEQDFKNIIADVLMRKGDTDTNGAIVGGLIGAIIGFDKLPTLYLKKQFGLTLNNSDKNSRMSTLYEPRRQFFRVMQMIQKLDQFQSKQKPISFNQKHMGIKCEQSQIKNQMNKIKLNEQSLTHTMIPKEYKYMNLPSKKITQLTSTNFVKNQRHYEQKNGSNKFIQIQQPNKYVQRKDSKQTSNLNFMTRTTRP